MRSHLRRRQTALLIRGSGMECAGGHLNSLQAMQYCRPHNIKVVADDIENQQHIDILLQR